jgi:hypothetical protein
MCEVTGGTVKVLHVALQTVQPGGLPFFPQNAERLDSEIRYDRDFDYDYFGFKTLERSYLLRINGKIIERPQHMLMRVAVSGLTATQTGMDGSSAW